MLAAAEDRTHHLKIQTSRFCFPLYTYITGGAETLPILDLWDLA